MNNQFINLIEKGNLSAIQEYYQQNPTINISADNEKALLKACIFGHLDVAQWLLRTKPDINIFDNKNYPFYFACKFNHLDIAQWIYSLGPEKINLQTANTAFVTACNNGNLEFAQWVKSIQPDLEIIFNCNEVKDESDNEVENENEYDNHISIFVIACSSGNYELVKWLFEIRPNEKLSEETAIDAFIHACHHGSLEIAKLILEKKPDLNFRADNDYVFKNTWLQFCDDVDGCLEVAKWLATLCSEYTIIEEGEYINCKINKKAE